MILLSILNSDTEEIPIFLVSDKTENSVESVAETET